MRYWKNLKPKKRYINRLKEYVKSHNKTVSDEAIDLLR